MIKTMDEKFGDAAHPVTENPFDALLATCNHDATQIIQIYEDVRAATLARQTNSFLEPDFGGVEPDEILSRLISDPAYADPRFNVALISKPPSPIQTLVVEIQNRLRPLLSEIWFAPPDSLHMTSLEIAPALTEPECDAKVSALLQALDVQKLCSGLAQDQSKRTVLARPRLTFDRRALAVTFVPVSSVADEMTPKDYTYHHWRRDLWAALHHAGIGVRGRYVAASAHITIARFVRTEKSTASKHQEDGCATENDWPRRFVEGVADINAWLERVVWPASSETEVTSQSSSDVQPSDLAKGVWRVGEQTGLQLRCGRSWYGGGRIVVQGDAY